MIPKGVSKLITVNNQYFVKFEITDKVKKKELSLKLILLQKNEPGFA